jgi:hypothetical protein
LPGKSASEGAFQTRSSGQTLPTLARCPQRLGVVHFERVSALFQSWNSLSKVLQTFRVLALLAGLALGLALVVFKRKKM